jgi:hypothetical protein
VLVDGDPSTKSSDLRQTRLVMLEGKLLDADVLRVAAGFQADLTESPCRFPAPSFDV